jgi:RNA polymerase sigma-70 factor, ECF subfamily
MSIRDGSLVEIVHACLKSREELAWGELIFRLQPAFARIAWRVATGAAGWKSADTNEVDDIVQEVFLKLGTRGGQTLERVPLENDASVLAYLKAMAGNVARDYFKAKYAGKRGVLQTVGEDSVRVEEFADGPEKLGSAEKYILIKEIDRALKADRRERTIFWLYYRQGLTAKEIAVIPVLGLSEKGVESMILRLATGVREGLRLARKKPSLKKGDGASWSS